MFLNPHYALNTSVELLKNTLALSCATPTESEFGGWSLSMWKFSKLHKSTYNQPLLRTFALPCVVRGSQSVAPSSSSDSSITWELAKNVMLHLLHRPTKSATLCV